MMIEDAFGDVLQPGAILDDAKSRPGKHVGQPGAKQRAVVDNYRRDPAMMLAGSERPISSPT
jgi:hypothetical protein